MVRTGSLNVRGFRDVIKVKALYNYFIDQKLDVICIQDTHSSPDIEIKLRSLWPGESEWHHQTTQQGGVAILVRKGLSIEVTNRDENGRILFAKILDNDTIKQRVSSCYAPTSKYPTQQQTFLNDLITFDELNPSQTYHGGDFNTILSSLDGNYFEKRTKYGRDLKNWLDNNNMVDTYRISNPETKIYTWSNKKHKSRIDFWLCDETLATNISVSKITKSILTDHKLITINTIDEENMWGKGL